MPRYPPNRSSHRNFPRRHLGIRHYNRQPRRHHISHHPRPVHTFNAQAPGHPTPNPRTRNGPPRHRPAKLIECPSPASPTRSPTDPATSNCAKTPRRHHRDPTALKRPILAPLRRNHQANRIRGMDRNGAPLLPFPTIQTRNKRRTSPYTNPLRPARNLRILRKRVSLSDTLTK